MDVLTTWTVTIWVSVDVPGRTADKSVVDRQTLAKCPCLPHHEQVRLLAGQAAELALYCVEPQRKHAPAPADGNAREEVSAPLVGEEALAGDNTPVPSCIEVRGGRPPC
ncbi:hypothetical protein MTO96_023767 [Rhipicephalus appendiculatus]